METNTKVYSWFYDITPGKVLAVNGFPVPGKDGVPLCEEHAETLLQNEDCVPAPDADSVEPAHYCWFCE